MFLRALDLKLISYQVLLQIIADNRKSVTRREYIVQWCYNSFFIYTQKYRFDKMKFTREK